MNLQPSEVDRLAVWQLYALIEGWNRAQEPDRLTPPTKAEMDRLAALPTYH